MDSVKKEILLLISGMRGGGAERVIGILADGFAANSWDTTLMITNQKITDMVGYKLSSDVKVLSVPEIQNGDTSNEKLKYSIKKITSRIFGTLCEKLHKPVSDKTAHNTFDWQYHNITRTVREYLLKHPDCSVVAFLQPSVNAALMACDGLPNKIIISERLDPARYNLNRYMPYYARVWYPKATKIVFQTEAAQSYFNDEIKRKSAVIYNPLNPKLPEAYHGERNKTIVSFCRITAQKNLPLLVDAFCDFYKEFSDYNLEIYGEGEDEAKVRDYIEKSDAKDSIKLLPFDPQLHEKIKKSAMFVSSSDYEGMSNSMLEALAIGLPSICTDCPAGGARAIIKDHENGILVPVANREAMCSAMKELAQSPELCEKLSENAEKLRNELSVENIVKRWMELFDE